MNEAEDIITDFFNQVRMILGADAVPDTAAKTIERKLRCTWGGQEPYVRKDSESKAALIRAEFNGRNRVELQQKHGVSKAQFYRYLKGG